MKIYVAVTGIIFGLFVIMHIWRMTMEHQLLGDVHFVLLTTLLAVVFVWAMLLLWRQRRT
jgi:hypothetical protein